MAILFVYDRDNSHKDAHVEATGSWKRGMVVECFEDDKPCVKNPQPPFILVRVPGLSKAEAEAKYMQPEVDEKAKLEPGESPPILRRRRYALDLAAVEAKAGKAVDEVRSVSLTTQKLAECERDLAAKEKRA